MSEIRNDIFPNMLPYIGDKERFFEIVHIPSENQGTFLEAYTRRYREEKLKEFIDEAYQGISSLFQSETDFIDYINSFLDAETAELFIEICKFYFISKKYQPTTCVKLIMMLSIIEKTISKEKEWEEFHCWVFNQRSLIQESLDKTEKVGANAFLKIIESLKEEYFKEYGSHKRNVYEFFRNYASTDNQIRLIKAFRANYTKVIEDFEAQDYLMSPFPQTIEKASEVTKKPIENMMMPYCFNWQKCLVYCGDCDHSEVCELSNKSILK